ncbi:hypothetical protein CF386_09800 [Paraphotobacterium marinum]|uniref:Thioredoxin-like fold domain-containing protein n=1 Tax=Paraphotobacterium marinum TaxID=1755811 RepID=A0A220VGH9_9GAMM|nr:thioredoxin domain-containing protein [Paraphotobacterium marinum]ASK79346.1 hypothetical protein CF386_09800 [Paraphotobacterium marinum]
MTKNGNSLTKVAIVISLVAFGVAAYDFVREKNVQNEVDILKEQLNQLKLQTSSSTKAENIQMNQYVKTNELEKVLIENPSWTVNALNKFQQNKKEQEELKVQQLIKDNQDALYNNSQDPFIGNKNGSKVLVEFLDYNCGYCKKFSQIAYKLIKNNPDLKIIIKEFPIFGPQSGSTYGAEVATALFAKYPEKYDKFHKLLVEHKGKLSTKIVDNYLIKVGLSKSDIESELPKAKDNIYKNRILARKIGVRGTPSVFYGDERVKKLNYQQIQSLLQ